MERRYLLPPDCRGARSAAGRGLGHLPGEHGIAVPATLGGATLAEWLATGDGLGSLLVVSYSSSKFSTLWSGSVLIVALSVLLYTLVSRLEGPVLRRFSGQASPR